MICLTRGFKVSNFAKPLPQNSELLKQINIADVAELVDARDLKFSDGV